MEPCDIDTKILTGHVTSPTDREGYLESLRSLAVEGYRDYLRSLSDEALARHFENLGVDRGNTVDPVSGLRYGVRWPGETVQDWARRAVAIHGPAPDRLVRRVRMLRARQLTSAAPYAPDGAAARHRSSRGIAAD